MNQVLYANNQGNSVIGVTEIPSELGVCSDFEQERVTGTRVINGVTITTFKEGPAVDAEIGESFCSKDDRFLISFSPVNEVPELLNLENEYFEKFTC